MDPYDYDTIVFILKLVKELSPEETASTVDKVQMQFVCLIMYPPSLTEIGNRQFIFKINVVAFNAYFSV